MCGTTALQRTLAFFGACTVLLAGFLSVAILIVLWGITLALFVVAGVAVFRSQHLGRALSGFIASGVAFQILTLGQPVPVIGGFLVIALAAAGWGASRRDLPRLIRKGSAVPSRPAPLHVRST